MPLDPNVLLEYFNPDLFLIKITPVNPTHKALKNNLSSSDISKKWDDLVKALQNAGYDVILSIGELEENYIGSNCGQYVMAHKKSQDSIDGAYTYKLRTLNIK
jgi:23S rRNA (adenine2503-C2)-methyltransferase